MKKRIKPNPLKTNPKNQTPITSYSHEALEGKILAEACGIMIEGENKCKTLIQNSIQKKS
jgi:hypothetical protein